MNTAPAHEDPKTAPLPALSQFFTWAPGEQPAPYDPPRTSTDPLQPRASSSPPVIDVVPRPRPVKQSGHRRRWLVAAAGVVAAVAAAAVAFWPDGSTTDQPALLDDQASPTVAARLDPRLASLIPTGYPPGACTPVPTDNHSAAECGPNIAAPNTSSRFTLHRDAHALAAALDEFISGTTVLVCPGNYQSPVHCPTGVSKSFWDSYR